MRVRSIDFRLDASGREIAAGADLLNSAGRTKPDARIPSEVQFAFGEATSDRGHFTFSPSGSLAHRLMEERLCEIVRSSLGAEEIKTPLLFRSDAVGIADEAAPFMKQMYLCQSSEDVSLILRPGGDYGAFSFVREHMRTLGEWPLRIFECGPAFRKIQRGRINGIGSAREFTVLDYHSICQDEEHLWDEWAALLFAQTDALKALDVECSLHLEIVADFYDHFRSKITHVIRRLGVEASVKILDGPRNYWVLQHRFHLADGLGMMDGQLDYVNGPRYGIKPSDAQSSPALICHGCWGTVERLLWHQLNVRNGGLPLWLAPVQLCLLPCSEAGARLANDFLNNFQEIRRIEVLHLPTRLSVRLRRALDGTRWGVVVFGDREANSPDATIEMRLGGGGAFNTSMANWLETTEHSIKRMPFRPLPHHRNLRNPLETSVGT